MMAQLFEDGIDEGECALCESPLPGGGFGPDGEELCGKIAGAGGGEVEVPVAERAGEVPAFIQNALRSVGVGIDHQRRSVDGRGVRTAEPVVCFLHHSGRQIHPQAPDDCSNTLGRSRGLARCNLPEADGL